MKRQICASLAAIATFAVAPAAARADVTSVFDGAVPCTAQADGVRTCIGDAAHLVASWDGTPIDVNVVLPPAPADGTADGSYPLLGVYHGWNGSKLGVDASVAGRSLRDWAKAGVAVFTMSDRGWGDTCGGQSQTRTSQACIATGYNHLLDTRYEVRDAQTLIGRLADQRTAADGPYLVDAQRIGATGGSYGGGMSMALAALKDRIMLPNGSYAPWETPATHRPLRIAAAAPEIPWTDLAYSLMPTGRTLDYANGPSYGDQVGVMKASFVTGLFGTGVAASNYALPQTAPDADLWTWFATDLAGDPYDVNPLTSAAIAELQQHHSSFFIDHSEAPAPLLISNGFTDDLFPVDEAVRFRNRTKAQYPNAFVGLMDLDYGHQRGQNKAPDTALLHARQRTFLDHFLRGVGARPTEDAQAILQTCGGDAKAPSSAVYDAPTWAALAPGEVRASAPATQVVASAGDPTAGQAFDPISGGGACATATDQDVPGTAVVRFPKAPAGGYTVLGSTTIVADVLSTSPTNQIAARLLDVGTDGKETLVARGLLRPRQATSTIPVQEVFQLHPAGWHVAEGHVAKLELLVADAPYARPSNGQTPILVSNLEVRLPVAEAPDGTTVLTPAAKILPAGFTLAPDFGGPVAGGGTTGPQGDPGPQGTPGTSGTPGDPGAKGTPGQDGTSGAAGAAGSQGPVGTTGTSGPVGATGAPGRDARVVCSRSRSDRAAVRCTVKLVRASGRRFELRLSRGSRLVATARAASPRAVVLHTSQTLPAGRYRLRVVEIRGRHRHTVLTAIVTV